MTIAPDDELNIGPTTRTEPPRRREPASKADSLRRFLRRHQGLAGLAALALAGGSTWVLLLAVTQRALPEAVAWTVVGAVLGGSGLLIVNEILIAQDEAARAHPNGSQAWRLGQAKRVAAAAAAGLVTIGLLIPSQRVTVIGMVLVMIVSLAVKLSFDRRAMHYPRAWLGAGAGAMVLAVVLVAVSSARLLSVVGVALALVGLAAVKLSTLGLIDEVRSTETGTLPSSDEIANDRFRRSRRAIGAGFAMAVAGVLLFVVGTWPDVQQAPLLAFGLFLGIAGLSVAGIGASRLDLRRGGWLVAGVVALGLAIVVYGWSLTLGVVGDWRLLAVVASAILAAVGAWFVFRGESLVALVLITFVLAWALHDRDTQTPPASDAGRAGLLALGDSYASGEGAPDFITGTNSRYADSLAEGDPESAGRGNECRRSLSSYPALVADEADLALHHFACSGAEIRHVLATGQATNAGSEVAGWKAQLDHWEDATPAERDDPQVVLVGIGGNDTGFGTIVKACLLPTDCSEGAERWIAKAESLEPDLVAAYTEIDARTGDAPVVVVPYPEAFDARDCRGPVSPTEISFVVDFIKALNKTIYRAAREAGVLVADTAPTVADNGHCSEDPAVHLVVLAPTAGPVSQRLLPSNWVHGSMHPRPLGHDLQAALISSLVDDLRAGVDASPHLVDLATVDTSRAVLTGDRATLVAEADELLEPDEQQAWLEAELFAAGRRTIPGVALLLLGGTVVACGLVNSRHPWARFLVPPLNTPQPDPSAHLAVFALADTDPPLPRVRVLGVVTGRKPQAVELQDTHGVTWATLDSWHFFPGGRHPFWWSKADLPIEPGQRVELTATATSATDGTEIGSATVRAVGPPSPSSATVTIVAGSCYDREHLPLHRSGGSAQERGAGQPILRAYEALVGHDEAPLHWWLGDQVYLDAPWTDGLRMPDIPDLVARRYLNAWEIGPHRSGSGEVEPDHGEGSGFGAVLARSTNQFLADDHEFWNGYPQLSYTTLPVHAIQRRVHHFRHPRRLPVATATVSDNGRGNGDGLPAGRSILPHPINEGAFGRVAGHAYLIFQSPLDVTDFSDQSWPPAMQVTHLEHARLILVETRWRRTLHRKSADDAGFALPKDLDELLDHLEAPELVVLGLSRPLLGHPPRRAPRWAVDVGVEAFHHQYTRLCAALRTRAREGRPTLVLAGDVHRHGVGLGIEGGLAEIVSSPLVVVGGPGTAWMLGARAALGRLAAGVGRVLLRRRSPAPWSFPDFADDGTPNGDLLDGEPLWEAAAAGGSGAGEGLARIDLDLSKPDTPTVTYRFADITGQPSQELALSWSPDRRRWQRRSG